MYRRVKRLQDLTLSLLALIFLLPVFLIIGLLIKIDSEGPIFFIQKRSGEYGSYFKIYKFRSMKVDTPDLATDKLEDPGQYLTRMGMFLRKTSLDELPQLVNIIRGDMSFVGPRPALYNQYELIEARKSLGIVHLKPGLTGFAQIMGRDFITDKQKIVYDKYYLDNISFLLDMKIIFRTFYQVIKAENVIVDKKLTSN